MFSPEILEEKGFIVLEGVVTNQQADTMASLFYDYMEKMSPEFKRDDRSTWTEENLPIRIKGLIQHYNVGWQPHAYMARELLKPIFAKIWQTDDLVTSVDGTCFSTRLKRSPFRNVEMWQQKAWTTPLHIDQTTSGFSCVQGGLALNDQAENMQVFVCVPGSHKYHDEIMAMNGGFNSTNWMVMNDATIAFLQSKGLKPQRVPLRKGSVVLWDSRVVHASTQYCADAPDDAFRLQVFVCMLPRIQSQEEKEKRRRGYERGLVSRHTPVPVTFFPKNPNTRFKKPRTGFTIPPSAPLTEDLAVLHGL